MDYKDLITEAIIEFPELVEEYKDKYSEIVGNHKLILSMPIDLYEIHQRAYEQIILDNSTPSVYQFYEEIIRHHFIKLIDEYYTDRANDIVCFKISKMVEFFEKMASSGDVEVENVLLIGVFEGIIDDKVKLKLILTLLKEKSLLLMYKLQDYHDVDFSEVQK